MASVIIHKPGFLTTVQDRGRFGYQRFGMPVSGAMDSWSMELANLLVGNSPDAACLEATFSGPEIQFKTEGAISICGADMEPLLNDQTIPNWRTIHVNKNDRLSFAGLISGCRTYIAFTGGIGVPEVMGSRSTCLRAKLGGFKGRALMEGDEVPIGNQTGKIKIKEVPVEWLLPFLTEQVIRIIPGPEVHRFSLEGIKDFLTATFMVSDECDRMGYRLKGPAIQLESETADIISAGISPGTVQVTSNGQPIVLMADRQTTGGYARLANVASADLPLVAQMKPGDRIHFREISLEEAQYLIMERVQRLKEFGD